ncbi:MAK10-like protein [Tanacetum coccineum]
MKLVDALDLNGDNRERTRLRLFQFSLRDQASNWLERLPAGSISTWEDITTRFLAHFFPPGRTFKLCNDILMFQQHQGESLSEAWTRFKGLLQKVPHRVIDLWLKILIFYDHVNPITSWNDPRDFAKPVKAISMPQYVPSTSDRRLIELENQVQCLMEAHLVPNQPVQVNKIASSCEICSGLHDTQYCMENPEQAFVEYASSRTDETGVNTLTVNEIETPNPKEPEKAIEDEFADLHLNLPVFEVLAHVTIYDALLDKHIVSLELGKNGSEYIQSIAPEKMKDPGLFILPCRLGDSKPFDTLADLGSCGNLIPFCLFKKLKIGLLEETDDVLGLTGGTKSNPVGIVKIVEVHVGKLKLFEDFHVIDMEKEPTCPLLVGKGFLATANAVIDCKKAKIAIEEGLTREWDIARDAEVNPFKDVLVFRKMVEFLGAIPIDLKGNMWESGNLVKNNIDWNRPPKDRDGAWHIRIELIDPDGEKFDRPFQSIPTTRKLSLKENPSDILNLDHFHDSLHLHPTTLFKTSLIVTISTYASSGGLILYQANGRKAHLLEDKQIPSVGVFDEKPDKMTIWLEDGLKNQDQSVETASGKLVTPSESHSDDVWKFVTPSGSTVIKEALETLAWK